VLGDRSGLRVPPITDGDGEKSTSFLGGMFNGLSLERCVFM